MSFKDVEMNLHQIFVPGGSSSQGCVCGFIICQPTMDPRRIRVIGAVSVKDILDMMLMHFTEKLLFIASIWWSWRASLIGDHFFLPVSLMHFVP